MIIVITTGVVDSSGMIFYYIDTPRQHSAGILEVGHQVNQYMIIPPKARNYTIFGFCSASCTQVLIISIFVMIKFCLVFSRRRNTYLC